MKTTHDILPIVNDPTPWIIAQPNKDRRRCALWLQGWGSTINDQQPIIERLADKSGTSFAMVEYAGHGTHTSEPSSTTREQQHAEVVATYDALKKLGYGCIVAIGYSFGGYMAALLTRQRELAGVIMQAPAIYDDAEFTAKQADRDDARYQRFKKTVHPSSRLVALEALQNFDNPVHVIEYGADEVIPPNIPRSYVAAAKQGYYSIIPEASHVPESAEQFAAIEAVTLQALTATWQKEPETS